jgi:CheY-like chemotaxis protein
MTFTSVMGTGPESARLATLRSYAVLDSGPEPAFDVLVRIAAESFGASSAAITLVDADRCWFKARVGLDAPQTPRDVSFCGHAFASSATFVVPDALADERFRQLPLVTGAGFRFYAGAPLRASDGHALGTLCVLDRNPCEPDRRQLAVLRALADQVMMLLEARRMKPGHTYPMVPTAMPAGGIVLVVDDEASVRSFTAEVMKHLGYEPMVAGNGAEALVRIAELGGRVRIVVTDISMPIMGGVDLVRALRRQPDPPAIVAMSGNFTGDTRGQLRAEGVTSMLGKPFSMDDLRLALMQAQAAVR